MLRTTPIRRFTNDLAKRWTCDDYFDLVVWYEPHGTLFGFQLSYDRFEYQRTLKWTLKGGYLHAIVNEGANDSPCLSFVSPTMTHGAEFPFEKVHTEFIRRTPQLDPELRDFINHHIMIFGLKQQAR